jgi:hypothetical protein
MIRRAAIALMLLAALPAQAESFTNWLASYGITNTNPAHDSDLDGISNLMEYALADLDPTVVNGSSDLPTMVYGVRATNTIIPFRDLSVITATNTHNPPSQGFWYLGLRYKPRPDTEGIRWRPQYSWWAANFGYWLDGRAVFFPPVADGTNGHVIRWMSGMFRASAPPDAAWLRLKVEVHP